MIKANTPEEMYAYVSHAGTVLNECMATTKLFAEHLAKKFLGKRRFETHGRIERVIVTVQRLEVGE